MATSNAMNTSNQYIKYTISITQNSQSIANNSSNVTVSVRFYRTNTGYTSYGTGTVYCKINGTQYSASVSPSQGITNSGIVLFAKTLDIPHWSDGTKNLTCSAWISHDVVTSSEQSYSQALSTIYRASKPTLSASSVKMGGSLTITTNRKSASFTHTLQYTVGATTVTFATGVGDSLAWTVPDLAANCNNSTSCTAVITCVTYNGSTTVGTETCSVTLNVPSESTPSASDVYMGNKVTVNVARKSTNFTHAIDLYFNGRWIGGETGVRLSTEIDVPLSLAKEIPNSPYGTASILCTTYNGTAKVGSTTSTTFVAYVPNDSNTRPQFSSSGFAIAPTGDLPPEFSGLYIQNKTGVKATFTASSTYSTIASYKLTADGRNFFGNPATADQFARSGNFTVTGTVTDNRGFYTTQSKDITVIPYSTPTIEPSEGYPSIICERSTHDGTYDDAGTFLHIKCRLRHSSVAGKNNCHLQYQYKSKEGAWSTPTTPSLAVIDANGECECTIPDVVSQTDMSYTIRLIIADTIGSEEHYDFPIPTADVTLHLGFGGYGVSVGKYSEATEDNKMFESAWDAHFQKGIYAKHIGMIATCESLDFDTLVDDTGYYAGFSSPQYAGCTNYPVDKTGVLEVISHMFSNGNGKAVFAHQTYRTYDGEIYTRSYYSERGWTSWAKLATTQGG